MLRSTKKALIMSARYELPFAGVGRIEQNKINKKLFKKNVISK